MITRLYRMLPIALLLLVFLALATLYNHTIPLWEGPDEPGHMRYILFLAQEHRLPMQRSPDETSDVPGEGHQPPLAYLLALPVVAPLVQDAPMSLVQRHNPAFLWGKDARGNSPAAFVRSSSEYPPWQGSTLAAHRARTVSALWGALTIFCTWGAATTLLRHAESRVVLPQATKTLFPLVAAMLVAFSPQVLFTAALVTNDMLLAALSSLLLWLCVIEPKHDTHRRYWRTAACGIVLGLALLTKQSALLWVPLLVWRSWRDAIAYTGANVPGQTPSTSHVGQTVTFIALWAGIALVVSGWWYGRNGLLYGDLLGLHHFQSTFATQPFAWYSPSAWGHALRQLHTSFWAMFGWLSITPPSWVLAIFTLLEGAAIGGLLLPMLRPRLAHTLSPPWAIVALLPLVTLVWVVTFGITAGIVAWQGRLLFPALAAIALLLARGLVVWLPLLFGNRPMLQSVFVFLAGIGGATLASSLATTVIAPAYTWHTLPAHNARQQLGIPVYARYAKEWERGAELRGLTLTSASLETTTSITPTTLPRGETVMVTCTWHALEHITYDWTVFVHMVDSTGHIVAEHNGKPRDGLFSMLLWAPGDWLQDPHPLSLPTNIPSGVYTLRVGWYKPWQRDPQKGSRQQVWDRQGVLVGDVADVAQVWVQ